MCMLDKNTLMRIIKNVLFVAFLIPGKPSKGSILSHIELPPSNVNMHRHWVHIDVYSVLLYVC